MRVDLRMLGALRKTVNAYNLRVQVVTHDSHKLAGSVGPADKALQCLPTRRIAELRGFLSPYQGFAGLP